MSVPPISVFHVSSFNPKVEFPSHFWSFFYQLLDIVAFKGCVGQLCFPACILELSPGIQLSYLELA